MLYICSFYGENDCCIVVAAVMPGWVGSKDKRGHAETVKTRMHSSAAKSWNLTKVSLCG